MKKHLVSIIIIMFATLYLANLVIIGNKTETTNQELLQLSRVSNTYHRANSCIITMEPSMRTPEFKNECYDRAEETTGTKVERFHVNH